MCVWLVLHQETRVELLLTLKLYSYSKGEITMNLKFGESRNILFVQILKFWIFFFIQLSKTDIVRKIICIQVLNTRVTYYLGPYIMAWKSFTCHLPFTFSTKKMLIVHLMFFSYKNSTRKLRFCIFWITCKCLPKQAQCIFWLLFILKTKVSVDLVQLWQNIEDIQILNVDKFTMPWQVIHWKQSCPIL